MLHKNNLMTTVTESSQDAIAVSDERDLGAFIPSVLDDFGLDPYQFRVYCRLARRAGAGGQCWESINNIADKCRINRKTVMNAIASLLKMEMIKQIKQPGKCDGYELTEPNTWINPQEAALLPDIGKPGWVYLIEAIGSNRYKIGRTNNVEKRIADLSKQSCFPLVVVGVVFVNNPIEFELNLHKQCGESRVHGEWFHLSYETVKAILSSF